MTTALAHPIDGAVTARPSNASRRSAERDRTAPDPRTGHRTAMTDILPSLDPVIDDAPVASPLPADAAAEGVVLTPLSPDPPDPAGEHPPRPGAGEPTVRTDDEPGDDDSLAARSPVARCADGNGTLTALFFSDDVVDIARAKAMCALCPLRPSCLAGALEREEPWGVWGGELLSGGRVVANKRPCGRPPKVPRPEVVYDEMGPVGFDLTA